MLAAAKLAKLALWRKFGRGFGQKESSPKCTSFDRDTWKSWSKDTKQPSRVLQGCAWDPKGFNGQPDIIAHGDKSLWQWRLLLWAAALNLDPRKIEKTWLRFSWWLEHAWAALCLQDLLQSCWQSGMGSKFIKNDDSIPYPLKIGGLMFVLKSCKNCQNPRFLGDWILADIHIMDEKCQGIGRYTIPNSPKIQHRVTNYDHRVGYSFCELGCLMFSDSIVSTFLESQVLAEDEWSPVWCRDVQADGWNASFRGVTALKQISLVDFWFILKAGCHQFCKVLYYLFILDIAPPTPEI